MREWVHGIRSGANSIASLDILLPFPPTNITNKMPSDRQQLEELLQPSFDERAGQAVKPDSGLPSYLWSLCPKAPPTSTAPR